MHDQGSDVMQRRYLSELRLALVIVAQAAAVLLMSSVPAFAHESQLVEAIVIYASTQEQASPSDLPLAGSTFAVSEADGQDTSNNSEDVVQEEIHTEEIRPGGQCNCCTTRCCTKADKREATKAMKSAYAGVFYANNFSYLCDPCYTGPCFCGESLKNMKTRFGTISVGGETRFRYHDESNFRGPNGLTGDDDSFLLFRQRFYADWQMTDDVRVYGEILDANSSGENLQPLINEENDCDILNLFVDLKLFECGDTSLIARIGRQEMLYSAQRTISPLDWANTRRTFEGVRALYENNGFSLDTFWTRPVQVNPKGDDRSDEKEDFFGAYATMKKSGGGSVAAYYLGYNSDNVSANPILNRDFTFHTIGGRTDGKTNGGMLYDFEGAFQFGKNNDGSDHSAGFVTLGLGRKLDCRAFQPTVWAWYDYASGEKNFADVSIGDNGYHHLFPLDHKYNGFMDLFGRRNLHDLSTQVITPITANVDVLVWYHYLLLAEDTLPYNLAMVPYSLAGGPAQDRELGHEIDVLFNINLSPRDNVLLGYSHFFGGAYYDPANIGPANGDKDADFFYAQFQTRY